MKVLLIALNAKFTHTNLALRYIRAYFRQHKSEISGAIHLDFKEYTINSDLDYVLRELVIGEYDLVCASAYIWNAEEFAVLLKNFKKVSQAKVLMGGPEVTYKFGVPKYADAVIRGEGERAFFSLLKNAAEKGLDAAIDEHDSDRYHLSPDFGSLSYPYDRAEDLEHRTLYYESSRGCPYSCTYCLSSARDGVRQLPLERVLAELTDLFSKRPMQIKFVDRTFNASSKRAHSIISHILSMDNGYTSVQFEVGMDRFGDDLIDLLAGARKGFIQLEAGVQTTNPKAMKEIKRVLDFQKIKENSIKLLQRTNVHLHLDLIAGLPYEGYDSFLNSIDDVYSIGAQKIQMGFLKVLAGTKIYENQMLYGMEVRENTPYEILSTKWLSALEVVRLKEIEEVLEIYHSSGRFKYTLADLVSRAGRASRLFENLADFYRGRGYFGRNMAQLKRFEILQQFGADKDLLKLDYLFENPLHRPESLGFERLPNINKIKTEIITNSRFLNKFYQDTDSKQLARTTGLEIFNKDLSQVIESAGGAQEILDFAVTAPTGKHDAGYLYFADSEIRDRIIRINLI